MLLHEALKYAKSHSSGEGESVESYSTGVIKGATDGEIVSSVTIPNLPYGYYVIGEETGSVSGEAVTTALLTAIHTEAPVDIITKDVAPTVNKFITEDTNHTLTAGEENNSAEIGDTVNFKVVANLPDVQGYSSYKYTVVDTFDKGLDYTTGSVNVWYYSKKGDTVTDSLDTQYYDVGYSKDAASGKGTLTIDFHSDWIRTNGIHGLANTHTHSAESSSTTSTGEDEIDIPYIVITYSAKVNKDAELKNTNNVKITYSNNPSDEDSEEDTPTDETNTYVYAVNLIKKGYDSTSSTKIKYLDGAEFKLKNAAGKYAKLTQVGGGYTFDPTYENHWVDTADEGTTIYSNDSETGVKIMGLEAGTYAFEEIMAPDGYERVSGDIKFTIDVSSENNTYAKPGFKDVDGDSSLVTVVASGTAGVGNVTVENIIDGLLPGTGGVGRVMVYALGSILVLGAAVLFVLKRRSGKNA